MDVGVSYRNKPFLCVDLAPCMVFISALQTSLYQHPQLSFCFRDRHVRVFTPRCGSCGFEVLPRFNPCNDTHRSRGTQGVLVIVYRYWKLTKSCELLCSIPISLSMLSYRYRHYSQVLELSIGVNSRLTCGTHLR